MDTIIIKSPTPHSLYAIKAALSRVWKVEETRSGRLVIDDGRTRVYVYANSEFELFLDYTDVELVKEVIKCIADSPELTVDNDFDTILPGDQFVKKLRSKPSWNWRRSQ
jgi:hypothetical protein